LIENLARIPSSNIYLPTLNAVRAIMGAFTTMFLHAFSGIELPPNVIVAMAVPFSSPPND